MMRPTMPILLLAWATSARPAIAAGQEITFVARTVSGAPVSGVVFKKQGSVEGQFRTLGPSGKSKVTDFTCVPEVTFQARPDLSSVYRYSKKEWKDCEYPTVTFTFNVPSYGPLYEKTIQTFNNGSPEIKSQLAMPKFGNKVPPRVLSKIQPGALAKYYEWFGDASAFQGGHFGKLAVASAQLAERLCGSAGPVEPDGKIDPAVCDGLAIIEKDSIARALGVEEGIDLVDGTPVFTLDAAAAILKFARIRKLPKSIIDPKNAGDPKSVDDPKLLRLIANFLAQADLVKELQASSNRAPTR